MRHLVADMLDTVPFESIGVIIIEPTGEDYTVVKSIGLSEGKGSPMGPDITALHKLSKLQLGQNQLIVLVHSHPDCSEPTESDVASFKNMVYPDLGLPHANILGTLSMPPDHGFSVDNFRQFGPFRPPAGVLPKLKNKERWLQKYLSNLPEYMFFLKYSKGNSNRTKKVELVVTD